MALRSTAEPGRKVGEASALRLMPGEGVTLRVEGSSVLARRARVFRQGREPRPNTSIERTPSGMLRMPPVAAHVKR